VDREDSFRRIFARAAFEIGIELIRAATGAAAMRMAIEKRPQLIVMGISTPNVDGLQTLRHLKAIPETRSIPIVIYSDRSDAVERDSILLSGANDYLETPFDLHTLVRCLEHHLFHGCDTNALADTPPSAPHAIRRKT
jgi:DNA-binding response OmpR family regulator